MTPSFPAGERGQPVTSKPLQRGITCTVWDLPHTGERSPYTNGARPQHHPRAIYAY